MAPRPERKNRTCCCCIPTRIGVAILAWLYFLGGIAATVLAVMVFIRTELTIYTMDGALVIVLAALSGFVAVAAAFGIAATITQSPSLAKVFSGLFTFWFYLQVAFDIAIIALLFAKKLDHFVSECGYRRPTSRQERNCDRARSRTSLFYTIQAVIRAAIGFYFTRRVSSYTRHCSELADPELHNHLQMMAASAKAPAVGSGTTFASNMPTVVQRQPYDAQTPAPGQASFASQGLNVQGGYPGQFQASSDSIQGAEQVKEAPQEYNNTTTKAV